VILPYTVYTGLWLGLRKVFTKYRTSLNPRTLNQSFTVILMEKDQVTDLYNVTLLHKIMPLHAWPNIKQYIKCNCKIYLLLRVYQKGPSFGLRYKDSILCRHSVSWQTKHIPLSDLIWVCQNSNQTVIKDSKFKPFKMQEIPTLNPIKSLQWLHDVRLHIQASEVYEIWGTHSSKY
jgi:hypothetical protein